MATLTANRNYWNSEHDWRSSGDEWSRPWGGVASQWHATILPRIHHMLPAATIVEIACGFGRWTSWLADRCDNMIAVDVSPRCVEACRVRFSRRPHVECYINDGRTLQMVRDRSVDFVFSFDSLVHCDRHVVDSYLHEIARVLRPHGAAFIHHSNLRDCGEFLAFIWRHPYLWHFLSRLRLVDGWLHSRDHSVGATTVRIGAAAAGLSCVVQETVGWRHTRAPIDCFSTLFKTPSRTTKPLAFLNGDFGREMDRASAAAEAVLVTKQPGAHPPARRPPRLPGCKPQGDVC